MKRSAWVLGLVVAISSLGFAATSASTSVNLTAKINESITVSVAGGPVDFGTVTPGSGTSTQPTATINTNWLLSPTENQVTITASFATPASAMSNTVDPIPGSAVQIKGGDLSSFTGLGAAQTIKTITITNANKKSSDSTVVTFNLNLLTLPNLSAGTYTGTLDIVANATP